MAPPVRGGSWESWQPDLPGRQPLGAARADRLLGGRGRQGKVRLLEKAKEKNAFGQE